MLLILLACSPPDRAPPASSDSALPESAPEGFDSAEHDTCGELVWHEGDLEIDSSEAWSAFCATGANAIDGELLVEGWIDLGEPCLCEVSGHVQVQAGDAEGLRALRSAGSVDALMESLTLTSLERTEELSVYWEEDGTVALPLTEVRRLSLSTRGGGVGRVELPELVELEMLAASIDELEAARLETVGSLGLYTDQAWLPALVEADSVLVYNEAHLDTLSEVQTLDFVSAASVHAPELSRVGLFTIRGSINRMDTPLPKLSEVELLVVDASETNGRIHLLPELPALTSLPELELIGCEASALQAFSALIRVEGRLRVSQSDGDLSALVVEQVDSLVVRELDSDLLFPSSLGRIDDKLVIERNTDTRSIPGLEQLEEVGGKLVISGNTLLEDLDGLSGLKRVGGKLEITHNPQLEQSLAEAFASRLEIAGEVQIEDNRH